MSKFNTTNTMKTTNKSGYVAFSMTDKEHLVTAVLTTMFGEPKYYGNNDNELVHLATNCAKDDPDFLARLACYARNEANLRSVSHVLACIIAHDAPEYTRTVLRNVVVRPDDILEIFACFKAMYQMNPTNAMKRETAELMKKFDEYQFAKYNSTKKDFTFKDILRITHPKPDTADIDELFSKIKNGTLETPYTWETELSAKGNTAEVWNELIASGRVGYMALLRNLRNIVKSGANVYPVLKTLSDPEQVKKSRQLPFRFFNAYAMLNDAGYMTTDIRNALEKAIRVSVDNMEKIPGRTLIAVDVSGSMGSRISRKSVTTCRDISVLLGVLANKICESSTVCYFSYEGDYGYGRSGRYEKTGFEIAKYDEYDSVLDACEQAPGCGGGTDMHLPMKYALNDDNGTKPFDRVIYLSDNECNCAFTGNGGYGYYYSGREKTVQSEVEEYRRKFNKDFWVHGVDLQGYGTQQFCGDKFNLIAGWNDNVLEFILTAERGIDTLVNHIANYEFK